MPRIQALRLSCLCLGLSFAASCAGLDHPRVKWAFQTEGPIRGAAVVAGERVYFGSADGNLYCVNRADGGLVWSFPTGGSIAGAPAVAGDLVIVTGRGRTVHALDRRDGAVRWTFALGEARPTTLEWSFFTPPPVVQGDQLLVPSADGHLYALDPQTGAQRWAFRTGDRLFAAPLVADGTVYQPSGDDHVYALDLATGALRWKFATAGVAYDLSQGFTRSDIFTQPVLRDGRLLFGSRDGNVYALDLATQRAAWTFAYDSTWAMALAADDTTAYVGWSTNNRINALDLATGAQRWEFDAGSHTYTTPLVLGEHTYWASANGRLHKLDRRTGALAWTYRIGSDVYSPPSYSGGVLYLGTDDGRLLALVAEATPALKAVYLPDQLPGALPHFVIDPALAPYLVERGYVRLDSSAALAGWLEARREDGAASVVVFGLAQIPAAVIGDDPAAGLLRQYLAAGGKVVWPWGLPNLVTFDAEGKFLAHDPTVAARLLELVFVPFQDSGNYYSRATQAGRNWGLPAWLKTTFASLAPGNDVTVLAVDEFDRPTAFVKSFHSRQGSGWVTFSPKGFGSAITPEQLAMLERVASYTLD